LLIGRQNIKRYSFCYINLFSIMLKYIVLKFSVLLIMKSFNLSGGHKDNILLGKL